MQINLDDIVSITDLGRDLSAQINKVSYTGRRLVVMNRNKPTAAIIPIADLELLDVAAQRGGDKTALELSVYPDDEPAVPSGFTRLGISEEGPVDLPLTANLVVAGRTGRGTSCVLSALLAYANPDDAEAPVEFLAISGKPQVSSMHAAQHDIRLALIRNATSDAEFDALVAGPLMSVINERRELLRAQQCNTWAEHQEANPGAASQLVVAIIDCGKTQLRRARPIFDALSQADIGMNIWLFVQRPDDALNALGHKPDDWYRVLCRTADPQEFTGLFGPGHRGRLRANDGRYSYVASDGGGTTEVLPFLTVPPSQESHYFSATAEAPRPDLPRTQAANGN